MNATTQKRERENRVTTTNGRRDITGPERGYVLPEADVVETKDEFVLTVEMPGVSKEGLELTLESNVLTIVGRRSDGVGERLQPLFRESKPRDFRRVFELAPSIEVGKVEAEISQGVLTVHLPKAEKVKPRKIAVTG
jgi:HSP20 family protein